jgi:cytochrome b561
MTMTGTAEQRGRYSRGAIILHWAIAGFIVANLTLGSFMESLPAAQRLIATRLHESFGVTVFVLAWVRLAWRLTHKPPPFPADYTLWERWLAHLVQFLFYALMIVMPVLGWMIISSHLLRPMVIYWTLVLPPFEPFNQMTNGPAKSALHDQLVNLHATGAWIFVGLLCLHVAAALKHQFWDRQDQFARMGIGAAGRESAR